MPQISVLSQEEITAAKRKGSDPALIAPFVEVLKDLTPGQWVSVKLEGDDVARTVKRRMSLAATSLNVKLRWKRDGGDGAIRAEIVENVAATPAATTPASPPANGVNGKPATPTAAPAASRV